MTRPDFPKSPVPMLTEVVQVNGRLRPVVMPWAPAPADESHEPAPMLAADQEALADQVLARVQLKLAPILPELMRDAVDEVLREHLAQPQKVINSSNQ